MQSLLIEQVPYLKYNMQNMLEDFYIPIRGNDQATKIDTTKGLDYAAIEDVEY